MSILDLIKSGAVDPDTLSKSTGGMTDFVHNVGQKSDALKQLQSSSPTPATTDQTIYPDQTPGGNKYSDSPVLNTLGIGNGRLFGIKVPQPSAATMNKFDAASEGFARNVVPGFRFAEKNILGPESDAKLQQVQKENPQFKKYGEIAGTVASIPLAFALPAAKVAEGAGLGATAASAALNAAPYAAGAGLDVGAETGDWKKGLLAGGVSEAAGTVLPTLLSSVSKIPAVNRFLAKMQISGAGGVSGDINKTLRGYAKAQGMTGGKVDTYVASQADRVVDGAADLISQYGPTRAGKEAAKDAVTAGFQAHDALYGDLTGNKITPADINAVKADSDLDVLKGLFTPDQIDQAVEDMGGKINGQSWTHARNDILTPYQRAGNPFAVKKGNLSPNDQKVLESVVAGAWHDHIDAEAYKGMEMARTGQLGPDVQAKVQNIPNLYTLKTAYPGLLALTKSGAREAAKISKPFEGGSDTAARMLLGGNPIGTIGGAAVGATQVPGLIGDISQGNSDEIPTDIAKILGATVGGRLLNRSIGNAWNMGTGAIAGEMRQAGKGMSPAIPRIIANQTGKALMPQPENAQPSNVPQTIVPISATPTPTPSNMPQGSQANIQPSQNVPQQTQAKEQNMPQDKVDQAKQQTNGIFADRIDQNLQEIYRKSYGIYGKNARYSYDQFKAELARQSNNFDPHSEITADILFGNDKDRTDYMKAYDTALSLKNIDMDKAIQFYGLGGLTSEGAMGVAEQNRLVDAIARSMGKDDKESKNMIKAQIKAWRKEGLQGNQLKGAVSNYLTTQGGVRLPMLGEVGLQ